MPFQYKQSTGDLTCSGVWIGTGYAGNGEGLNNPDMMDMKGVGPLPQGLYALGKPYHHPHLGVLTFDLEPHPENEMFGRSLFRVHGDNMARNKTASDGCIIQALSARIRLAQRIGYEVQQLASGYACTASPHAVLDEILEVVE